MVDYVSDFLNSQIVGIPIPFIIALAVFIIFIMWLIKHSGKKEDIEKPPKIIEPEKEIIDNFKNIIDTTGNKLDRKQILSSGYMKIGRITGVSFYRHEKFEELKKSSKKNKSVERIADTVRNKYKWRADNFYLFEVIKDNIIFKILYNIFGWVSKGYFLVDMNFIKDKLTSNDYIISIFAQHKRFYKKIYVFSEFGQHVIQGMVNDLTVKQVLKETVNHIPQMHYFDYKTGRFSAKARELKDVESKAWREKEEKLEKEE